MENGKTDIAFLGFGDAAGNNPVYDLVRSDLVLNLDDILSGDKGKHFMRLFQRIFGRWLNAISIFIRFRQHLQVVRE